MTQEQTLTWAREAGLIQYVQVEKTCVSNALERFAALVAAHERETTGKVSLKYMNQQVLAEREACAKVCEEIAKRYQIAGMMVADECAAAIRNRGAKS